MATSMVCEKTQLQVKENIDLRTYLERFGLRDVSLGNIISYLRELDKKGKASHSAKVHSNGSTGNGKVTRLYLAEEQQVFLQPFQSFFDDHDSIDMVGISNDTSCESLTKAATTLKPKVILIGVKALEPATVEMLAVIRESSPDVAFVLLSVYYNLQGLKLLRGFLEASTIGCAYLLKHTIDKMEQITRVIDLVGQGRIILDPVVMGGMVNGVEAPGPILKELSQREVDILSYMAEGYDNNAIAGELSLSIKTVERHINNIYSKLGCHDTSKNPRVHAIFSYQQATKMHPEPLMVRV